jgi:hypothetical protein
VAKTISGGLHYYYQWDEEMRNDAKISGLPLDFRGDGGFVVIPPSALGDRGYSWQGANGMCPPFMLSPLPAELKELLQGRKSLGLVEPPIVAPSGLELNYPQKTEYDEGIAETMTPAQIGERNTRCTEYAGMIVNSLQPHLWEIYGWPKILEWNKSNPTPMIERELRTTWQSVCHMNLLQREKEGPLSIPQVNREIDCNISALQQVGMNSTLNINKDKETEPQNHNGDKFIELESNNTIATIYHGMEVSTEYARLEAKYGCGLYTGYDQLDFFFKFLPEQLYMISAQTHVGKSTFALNICARVASLGSDVLFCSLEQGIFIEPRVRSMLSGDFPEHLAVLTSDKMLTVAQLVQVIEQAKTKPQLICIDHIHFLKKTGRGATEDIDEIILGLQNMAKRLSVPVIVISHVRKLNNQQTPRMDDLKDSSSLSQVPAVVIVLSREVNKGVSMYDSMLSNDGKVYIAKNRIQGRTGVRNFTLQPSGNIEIKGAEESKLNRKAQDLEEDEVRTLFSS